MKESEFPASDWFHQFAKTSWSGWLPEKLGNFFFGSPWKDSKVFGRTLIKDVILPPSSRHLRLAVSLPVPKDSDSCVFSSSYVRGKVKKNEAVKSAKRPRKSRRLCGRTEMLWHSLMRSTSSKVAQCNRVGVTWSFFYLLSHHSRWVCRRLVRILACAAYSQWQRFAALETHSSLFLPSFILTSVQISMTAAFAMQVSSLQLWAGQKSIADAL